MLRKWNTIYFLALLMGVVTLYMGVESVDGALTITKLSGMLEKVFMPPGAEYVTSKVAEFLGLK
ncbi:hypothetical protein ATHEMM101B_10280 [Atlantibacter hermannii]|uniref:hypothetical protein n=1 Tax=Atlantibacter hermannii TaxID=565 RepID=UPI003B25A471